MIFNVEETCKSAMGVYIITNDIDSRMYIGSTSEGFAKRYRKHRRLLQKDKHINCHMQNWVNKFGIEHMKFSVLSVEEDKNKILSIEQEYLDMLWPTNMLFSISQNAIASMLGRKHPPEIRKKMSEIQKGNKSSVGRIWSAESREKVGRAHRGKIISQETRDKTSKTLKGRKLTEEWKNKIKASNTGKIFSEEHKYNLRKSLHDNDSRRNIRVPVVQYSLSGEFIGEFPSIALASNKTKIKIPHICRVCKGRRKSAGGFVWKYKKDIINPPIDKN